MRVTIDIVDTPAVASAVEVRTAGQETVTPAGGGEVAGGGLPGARQFDGGADLGAPAAGEAAAMPPTSARETGAARDGGAAPGAGETAIGRPIPVQIEASGGRNGGASAT